MSEAELVSSYEDHGLKMRSHVPNFGEWDNDDLLYTTYFENARKEKGGKIINPDDPEEENPEAFVYIRGGLESNYESQPVSVTFVANSSKPDSADKWYQNGAYEMDSYDHQKSARRQRNMALESASENRNGSDRPILHTNHRRANSGQKNDRPKGSSFSGSFSGQSQRNGDYQFDGNKHHRTASVPKFGEWDETDPTSGEGFTVIFNQVKEEKQTPNFPTLDSQIKTMDYSDSHYSKRPTPSWCSKSKICGCLCWRGSSVKP